MYGSPIKDFGDDNIKTMNSFFIALQFLTIIPLKINNFTGKKLGVSLVYFPVVGLLLGLTLAFEHSVLMNLRFSVFAADTVTIVSLIIFTGALHLDGLSDFLDAVSSGKPKEEMLQIMRDPHIGAIGSAGLISVILLKIALLSSLLQTQKAMSLVLMCVLSRWLQVFSIFLFPYARNEGKAKVFCENINLKIFLLAGLLALSFSLVISGAVGIIIFSLTVLAAYGINLFLKAKFGGITGDILGAVSEITEVLVLLCISLLNFVRVM